MSDASKHKLSYVVEATRNTTPANPRFQRLPDTRTTLAPNKEQLATERLTGDRFPSAPRMGAITIGGNIPADLSSSTYDDFIESALQGAFVNDPGAAADTITLEQDGVPTLNMPEGETAPTTNGIVTVERIDAQLQEVVLRYDPTIPGDPVTYELFGLNDTVTIDGDLFEVTLFTDGQESATAKAGDTRKSFSVLREFSDFGPGEKPFMLFTGCEVMSWNLTAAANGIAKSTFDFFGRGFVGPSTGAPAGTSYKPALDLEPFDTFNGTLKIDGVASCTVTDYNITINNGHAARFAVGCATSQDPSVGMSRVEGSVTVYFETAALFEKFINEESLAIELTLADSNGNKLIVNLPNLKILPGTQPDVTGEGPVTMPINFSAHKDDALGTHLTVQRIRPVAA